MCISSWMRTLLARSAAAMRPFSIDVLPLSGRNITADPAPEAVTNVALAYANCCKLQSTVTDSCNTSSSFSDDCAASALPGFRFCTALKPGLQFALVKLQPAFLQSARHNQASASACADTFCSVRCNRRRSEDRACVSKHRSKAPGAGYKICASCSAMCAICADSSAL